MLKSSCCSLSQMQTGRPLKHCLWISSQPASRCQTFLTWGSEFTSKGILMATGPPPISFPSFLPGNQRVWPQGCAVKSPHSLPCGPDLLSSEPQPCCLYLVLRFELSTWVPVRVVSLCQFMAWISLLINSILPESISVSLLNPHKRPFPKEHIKY